MSSFCEGNAIVYCEGDFNSPLGKTANSLIRRCSRYNVIAVIDSRYAGEDAGLALDGKRAGIPIVEDLPAALGRTQSASPTHFIVGVTSIGGRLTRLTRQAVLEAIRAGLNIDSGLHEFLRDDLEIRSSAAQEGIKIRDLRSVSPRCQMHTFSGEIDDVEALKIAVLGTDSAVGKGTTAWLLVDGLQASGYGAEFIGTEHTSWLQGAEYCVVLDSLVNDFVAGELEQVVVRAWDEKRPAAIVIEGQGSLLHPVQPRGFEILAATRPDMIVLQHAPGRLDHHGLPGCRVRSLETQIRTIETVARSPVVALAVNHERIPAGELGAVCESLEKETGLPAIDPLTDGIGPLVDVMRKKLGRPRAASRGLIGA